MNGKTTRIPFIILVLLLILPGCSELDSGFPPGESYQIQVLVNGSLLEDCSIIRSDDAIYPYFSVPVNNDPDLTSLLVYLENAQGELVGKKVLYVLETYFNKVSAAEFRQEDKKSGHADRSSKGKWGFINTRPAGDAPGTVIRVQSFDQEIPPFPLPKNMDIGPYSMVFEALGNNETLFRSETNIFYMGNTEFSLNDISAYLPGVSANPMIAPGTTVLLESNLDYDSRLEPYAIWYNGKSVISKGKLSEGAGRVLWQAPDQAGFYSLRLEMLPFQLRGDFSGISREITIPVSSKTETSGTSHFFETEPEPIPQSEPELPQSAITEEPDHQNIPAPKRPGLLRWYQFEGSLHDSLAEDDAGRSLIPAGGNEPLWTGVGQCYGLSTGRENTYTLSPISFFHDEDDQGGGKFLLHARPLPGGSVFTAFFPFLDSETEGVQIAVNRMGNVIILQLHTGVTVVETPIILPAADLQTFISAALEFHIRPHRFDARLVIDDDYLHSAAGTIRLPDALTGEGNVTLGGEKSVHTVWNEFAVLYAEPPPEEDFSEFITEEETADTPALPAAKNKTVIRVEVKREYRQLD